MAGSTRKKMSITAKQYALNNFNKHSHLIPADMVDSFLLYLTDGIQPGSFGTAVLCNDLKQAATTADSDNQKCLVGFARFMIWGMPAGAQGSIAKVEQWIIAGGLNGMEKRGNTTMMPENNNA